MTGFILGKVRPWIKSCEETLQSLTGDRGHFCEGNLCYACYGM